jgi:prepilin signal peptidase PulO-like enzyme (type II secretory pathway)
MSGDALVRTARSIAMLGCAILTGVAATVLVLELALRQLDGPEYVRVRQAEYVYFTWFIGIVFVPTFLAIAMLAIQTRRAPSSATLSALVLLVVAGVITFLVNGPINIEQQTWNVQTPPTDWAQLRDRWQLAHAVRTVCIALALCLLTATDRKRPVAGEGRKGRG